MTFPDEVSTITFSAAKSLDERSGKAEWVRAVFCKYKMDEGLFKIDIPFVLSSVILKENPSKCKNSAN